MYVCEGKLKEKKKPVIGNGESGGDVLGTAASGRVLMAPSAVRHRHYAETCWPYGKDNEVQ